MSIDPSKSDDNFDDDTNEHFYFNFHFYIDKHFHNNVYDDELYVP